ncbi:MAG TPA: histidine kinase, partial [Casimicrobiaceae bacterium]
MSIATDVRTPPLFRLDSAVNAIRGIDAAQLRVTAILGICLTLVTLAVFWVPIMQMARTNPLWAVVAEVAIGDQLRAFCLLVAVVIANSAADGGYPPRKAYVLAALVGCVVGVVVDEAFGWLWRAVFETGPPPPGRPWLQGYASLVFRPLFALTHWLLIGSAAVFLYAGRRAALRTAERLRAAELDRIRRSKLSLESRLQAMQARVEPQFLFNTLVQVERLYDLDAELAARMLDDLIAYLRAAMPLMRDTSSTVAQEFELARAYLDIVRLRLGERLAVTIETPPQGEHIRMPPMMLLPLIDHAIVRGFMPTNAEGAIAIRTDITEGRLRLTITDSGAGFVPETGSE